MSLLRDHLVSYDPDGATWTGLRKQAKVVGALMLRDTIARHGHENIGFFWVVGEPMLLTFGVMIMWGMTGQGHGGEIGVIPFALTGYSYITLWRHLVSRSIRPITRNAALFYLRPVRFFDTLIAGALLEIVGIFAAFLIVYTPFTLLGLAPVMHDPLLSVGGYLLLGWFGFAFGLILVAVSELSEAAEKFIAPTMYITMPLTGTFTMMDWLPGKAQKILIWSPLVSGIEMFRGGIFSEDVPVYYDVGYLVTCCVVLTALGLPLCRYAQRHVQI
jgi:capsular polysaccharide transport system permease protein